MKKENTTNEANPNVCPLSGLPIFQKSEWTDVRIDDDYGGSFFRLGDRIFVFRVRGYARYPIILETIKATRQAISEAFPPHVRYIMIEDYKHLEGVSLEARRCYISDLIDRNNLQAVIFCNTPPVFKVVYQLAQRIPFVRKRVYLVDGYREAVDLAVRISADKAPDTDGGEGRQNSKLPKPLKSWSRDAAFVKPYVDELLVFLASIHWWEKVHPSDGTIHIEPEHPFATVFEAIAHVKGDLDDLFQKNEDAIETLRQKENELQAKADSLEELNTALKVLLKKRREDRFDIEEKVIANIKQLIEPYLKKLEKSGLKASQKALVQIVTENLREITKPFSFRLASQLFALTPKEIQVANLVKQGRSSKEISAILDISLRTVDTHRRNLRSKMGIQKHKANLRTYLLSLD